MQGIDESEQRGSSETIGRTEPQPEGTRTIDITNRGRPAPFTRIAGTREILEVRSLLRDGERPYVTILDPRVIEADGIHYLTGYSVVYPGGCVLAGDTFGHRLDEQAASVIRGLLR